MRFFIKEWPNKTATLMAENGAELWTFLSVAEAENVCRDWYNVQGENVVYHLDVIAESNMQSNAA